MSTPWVERLSTMSKMLDANEAKRYHHQASDRLARPWKSAYFAHTFEIACQKVTSGAGPVPVIGNRLIEDGITFGVTTETPVT